MHIMTFLKGAAIGAGLMYLFDPSQGRKRRARIRDRAVHVWNETGDTVEAKTHDLTNRAQGLLHDAASFLSPGKATHRDGAHRSSSPWMPANWSPTTRMLVTAGAGLLALYGKRKGGALGTALGAASVAIITNSVSASELRRGFAPAPALPSDFTENDDEGSLSSGPRITEHRPRTARSF